MLSALIKVSTKLTPVYRRKPIVLNAFCRASTETELQEFYLKMNQPEVQKTKHLEYTKEGEIHVSDAHMKESKRCIYFVYLWLIPSVFGLFM